MYARPVNSIVPAALQQPEFIQRGSPGGEPVRPVRLVIGIDGCRGGWVIAASPAFAPHPVSIRIVPALAGDTLLADALATGSLIAIDMPIGLPSARHPTPRRCDAVARAALGPRGSSVFGVPCREAAIEADYRAALEANRRVLGLGISKQAHNICGKINELDSWLGSLGPESSQVFETHPELTVGRLAKNLPIDQIHSKKNAAGFEQRVALLEAEGLMNVKRLLVRTLDGPIPDRVGLVADDVIDALLCMLVARRAARGDAAALPPDASADRDERGLPMQIWV